MILFSQCRSKFIKQISISLDLHLSAWTDVALPSLWLPPHSAVSGVILMWWLEVPLQLLQWLSVMIWVYFSGLSKTEFL
jgi:hypothetical protein